MIAEILPTLSSLKAKCLPLHLLLSSDSQPFLNQWYQLQSGFFQPFSSIHYFILIGDILLCVVIK